MCSKGFTEAEVKIASDCRFLDVFSLPSLLHDIEQRGDAHRSSTLVWTDVWWIEQHRHCSTNTVELS